MGLIPVGAVHSAVGLDDSCGSHPTQNILWFWAVWWEDLGWGLACSAWPLWDHKLWDLRQVMAISAPRKSLWQSQKWGNFCSPTTLWGQGVVLGSAMLPWYCLTSPMRGCREQWGLEMRPSHVPGGSQRERMDVGVECQLERAHPQHRGAEQRRAALWVCWCGESPGRHKERWRDGWGDKGSAGAAPSPSDPPGTSHSAQWLWTPSPLKSCEKNLASLGFGCSDWGGEEDVATWKGFLTTQCMTSFMW